MDAVFLSGAPQESIHDLRPLGPCPLPCTVPPKNGRREPCGEAAWVASPGCAGIGAGRHPLAVQQMPACSQTAACSPV